MRCIATSFGRWSLILGALALGAVSASSQDATEDNSRDPNDSWCGEHANWSDSEHVAHCEVREVRLAPGRKPIAVDAGDNGGISITGWDHDEILVRVRIEAWAPTEAEARAVVEEIKLATKGPKILAVGPSAEATRKRLKGWGQWSASYRISVPRSSSLKLRTNNGSIAVDDVDGMIELGAENGTLSIRRTSGDVRGRTTNGSLSIVLSGDRWRGPGLDLETTNGNILISVPMEYSARLETGTSHGRTRVDLPEVVRADGDRRISAVLGRGGATVRAITTNGAVVVRRGS
jgi:Putative adhesin